MIVVFCVPLGPSMQRPLPPLMRTRANELILKSSLFMMKSLSILTGLSSTTLEHWVS
jgi:hypothetical protein